MVPASLMATACESSKRPGRKRMPAASHTNGRKLAGPRPTLRRVPTTTPSALRSAADIDNGCSLSVTSPNDRATARWKNGERKLRSPLSWPAALRPVMPASNWTKDHAEPSWIAVCPRPMSNRSDTLTATRPVSTEDGLRRTAEGERRHAEPLQFADGQRRARGLREGRGGGEQGANEEQEAHRISWRR